MRKLSRAKASLVEKKSGDQVVGATMNKTGMLKFKATKVGKDTVLAQIISMVEDALSSKAPIQRLADIASGYFVPAIIITATLSALVWYFIVGSDLHFCPHSFHRCVNCCLSLRSWTCHTHSHYGWGWERSRKRNFNQKRRNIGSGLQASNGSF